MGHIISKEEISVDPEKIEAIMSWPAPRKMTDVRYFARLAGYCRKCIEGYSAGKVEPIYRLKRLACEILVP